MGFVAIVYEATLNSVVFTREPWLDYPDKLWKISIYRGVARVGMFMIWNGLYFLALHGNGSNSLARTWFMTGLAAVCVLSMFVESFVMLSDHTLTSFGESWLPVKPLEGEPGSWKPRVPLATVHLQNEKHRRHRPKVCRFLVQRDG